MEIEVTPAGKSTKRLSLLSGGEKSLVALAFMFAVFLARPCPFYILDEVEAALDDMNIDRFLAARRAATRTARSSSSSPTRSARWTPPTASTASAWAATASRRWSRAAERRAEPAEADRRRPPRPRPSDSLGRARPGPRASLSSRPHGAHLAGAVHHGRGRARRPPPERARAARRASSAACARTCRRRARRSARSCRRRCSRTLDDETWERLEETLIYADVGARTTAKIVERLETEASSGELSGGEQLTRRLTELLAEAARVGEGTIDLRPDPTVILMVGVNGTGKTTTIGKIAWHLQRELGQVGAARRGRHLPGRRRRAARGVGASAPAATSCAPSRAPIRARWRSTPSRPPGRAGTTW